MNKSIILFIILVFSGELSAFTLPDNYISGVDLCELNKEQRQNELGHYVEVPVNYKNQEIDKTLIYTYTLKPFNKNLPSLIYFTGGPGASSRSSEFDLPNTNVIFFEQRGISCSKPLTKELFLNPNFYSSENTARDAKLILDSYGITKATIYGQSYGTIPATIFASLFKTYTNALIIEGVIYEGNETLWHSSIKKNLLQKFFNELKYSTQNKIIELSNSGKVPASWFSKIGSMMLYMNNGMETYKTFIDSILAMEENQMYDFINNFYPKEKMAEDYTFGDVMMGMIGCQEISMNNPELSLTLTFNNSFRLFYDKNNIDRNERCLPLGLGNFNRPHYRSTNYPVYAPVFYFLGEHDGATDLHQGMNHYRNTAKAQKSLVILKSGGHLPALGLLKDNRACDKKTENCDSLKQNNSMVRIFETIIKEQYIYEFQIDELNTGGELVFDLTH
jgi:proline iminopeptidase